MLHLGVAPLLLLVLGASLGAAFPRGALKKSCSLSKYQFLEPSELKAVQKMKEQFVSTAGNGGLSAGGGQGRGDAKLQTLSDKAGVFCGSLGMRRMLSRGVWGQGGCWAKFGPGVRLLNADWGCTTPPKAKMAVFQFLPWLLPAGGHHAAVGAQMQQQALPSEMEPGGAVGKSKAMLGKGGVPHPASSRHLPSAGPTSIRTPRQGFETPVPPLAASPGASGP